MRAQFVYPHSLEAHVHNIAGVGGILGWLVNTLASALVGLAVGALVVALVSRIARLRRGRDGEPAAHAA